MADHSQMLLPCSRAFAGMWTSTSAAEAVQVQSALARNTVNLTWSPATLLLAAKKLEILPLATSAASLQCLVISGAL